MFALGQLYLLWHRRQLDVRPAAFDIEDLARIIGVARDIEFVSHRPGARRSYHFVGEVLLVDADEDFPWRLLDLDTCGLLMEAAALGEEWG